MKKLTFMKTPHYLYLMITSVVGCGLFLQQVLFTPAPFSINWVLFVLLSIAIVLLNRFRVVLPLVGNGFSMDTSIYLATIFLYGLEKTLWLLLLSSFFIYLQERVSEWWKQVFNFAVYTIMIFISYQVFIMLSGKVGPLLLDYLFAYIASITVYFFINILLIALYFALATNDHVGNIMMSISKDSVTHYLSTVLLALILTILLGVYPIFGLILFTLTIIFISISFNNYFQLYEQTKKDKIYREQILNSLPVGIITADNLSNDYSMNTTAKKLLKIDPSKMIYWKKKRGENEVFWDILFSKKICKNQKVAFQTVVDNHLLLVSQTELLDQHDSPIGTIFHFIDITESEELQNRIHHSEKLALLGELAAGAAHEIRNPLTVISGFLTLMKQSFTTEASSKFQVPLLLKEFERINTIVEEMLMIAKPGAPMLKEVTVKEILNEIPNLFENSPGVTLNVDLDDTPLLLDAKQMKQVFYNLLRNSKDAMNGNGSISIYSERKEKSYQLFVEDTGSGIDKGMLKSLFDPFSTSKETGTGLGLTIVQRIIENHNGKIEVHSSSSKGTTFLITLPLAK
ncbi:MAG: sensor histidine kinase [Bacillaceae bacterium]|nr:sensor histidine kinase [Bacillaceae bacterium]